MDIDLQVSGVRLTALEGERKPRQSLPAERLAGGCQGLTSNTYGSFSLKTQIIRIHPRLLKG